MWVTSAFLLIYPIGAEPDVSTLDFKPQSPGSMRRCGQAAVTSQQHWTAMPSNHSAMERQHSRGE